MSWCIIRTKRRNTHLKYNRETSELILAGEKRAHSEKMLNAEIPGIRRRGRPKTRWKARRDMAIVGLSADEDSATWKQETTSHSDDPTCREKSEK